jgi:hypothetical protein
MSRTIVAEEHLKEIEKFTHSSMESLSTFAKETRNGYCEANNSTDESSSRSNKHAAANTSSNKYSLENDAALNEEEDDDDHDQIQSDLLSQTNEPNTPVTPLSATLQDVEANMFEVSDEEATSVVDNTASEKEKKSHARSTENGINEEESNGDILIASYQEGQRRSQRKRKKRRRASVVDLSTMDDDQFEEYFQQEIEMEEECVTDRNEEYDESYNDSIRKQPKRAAKKMASNKGTTKKKNPSAHNSSQRKNTASSSSSSSTMNCNDQEQTRVKMSFKSCREEEYQTGGFPPILYTHSFSYKYDLKFENVDERCLKLMDSQSILNYLYIDLVFASQLTVPQLHQDIRTKPCNRSWKCGEPIGQQSTESIFVLSCKRKKGGVLLVQFAINPLYDSKRFNYAKFRLRVIFRPGIMDGGFTKFSTPFCVSTFRSTASLNRNIREANYVQRYSEYNTFQTFDGHTQLHKQHYLDILLGFLKDLQ